jgi:glycosyltransferase involved in cell wall biosynthesis
MAGAVHQLVPSFAPRDAVGNHTVQVQQVLRGLGLESEIYVGNARPEVAQLTRPYRELVGGEGTWLLYQSSTGSPIADWLVERPEPLLVNYHNITPASFFAPWEPHVGVELQAGRRQLADLAPRTELAIADSTFNQAELTAVGYRNTTVVPILLDTSAFPTEVDASALDRLRHDGPVWLFVGRWAPNKCQHDLLKAFAVYRRVYEPKAKLRLVGGPSSHAYFTALEGLRRALQLQDAVDLCEDVSTPELVAHFHAADVYVSVSEHEGFGVPLLEAMHHRVPVVAYGTAAVPETMGDGGLCLASKSPAVVAAAVHRVVGDAALHAQLVAAGERRLATFDLATNKARFADAVLSVLGSKP